MDLFPECRSLERLVAWQEVGFSGELDLSAPELEETDRVDRIMAEAEAPDYWFAASRDGNREGHYRGDSKFSYSRLLLKLLCGLLGICLAFPCSHEWRSRTHSSL